jgi:hypothetical protein
MEPAASWYSAGQALWAGLCVPVMLIALAAWREQGGAWRLVIACVFALAAPACWAGGLVAGPTGSAYLLADSRPRSRRMAWVPLAASLVAMLVLGGNLSRRDGDWQGISLSRGLTHTAQAIPEALLLQNLGVDVATTPAQGTVLCIGLAALWAWSRGGVRPGPLEAAGATIVIGCYIMAYSFRGQYSFENLRDLGWYHAIPQIGAVLFAAGWWNACRGGAARNTKRPSWRALLVVAGLAALLLALHVPRALRIFLGSVYPLTASEQKKLPIPTLQRLRAIYIVSETCERQRRALARLDRAEQVARRLGVGRREIRASLGRVLVPDWPDQVVEHDALDLLDLPDSGRRVDAARVHAAFAPLLALEPERRPDWISPSEPWPPGKKAMSSEQ